MPLTVSVAPPAAELPNGLVATTDPTPASTPAADATTPSSAKSRRRVSSFLGRMSSKSPHGGGSGVGEISMPTQVQHVTHVGWSSQTGFDIAGLPEEWKALFKAAGVRRRDLVDPETSRMIVNILAENFSEAARRSARR